MKTRNILASGLLSLSGLLSIGCASNLTSLNVEGYDFIINPGDNASITVKRAQEEYIRMISLSQEANEKRMRYNAHRGIAMSDRLVSVDESKSLLPMVKELEKTDKDLYDCLSVFRNQIQPRSRKPVEDNINSTKENLDLDRYFIEKFDLGIKENKPLEITK